MTANVETLNLPIKTPARDNHIDTMKFLLIFSIFIFHFGKPAGNFHPLANIYQVSIFFLISGFWALDRLNKSPIQFICDAFKKYLIYWLFWVGIYTAYYTIANSFGVGKALEYFERYFSGVRGTSIYGMWFTPAFFFVSFIYFMLAKGLSKVFKFPKITMAWVCCVISFVVYYVTEYFCKIPEKTIFSFVMVPEFLFYFSLGAVVYIYICACKPKLKTSILLRLSNCFITLFAFLYFLMYFFKKENLLWGWTTDMLGGKLSFLPDLVTTIFMFFLISCIARLISCDFTAKIGKNTLGLCHSEGFIKGVLIYAGSLIGLTLKATNPIEVLIFAFVELVVGCYVVNPVADMMIKRILNVNKK